MKNKYKKQQVVEDINELDDELFEISDPDGENVNDEMPLSTFSISPSYKEKDEKKLQKKGMTQKHIILIIALAVAVVALTLVYFLAIKPIFDEKQDLEENPEVTPPELIEGEVLADDGLTIMMFPNVPRSETHKVHVVNTDPLLGGEFTVIRGGEEDSSFYVAEHGKLAPVTSEKMLGVITAAGYTTVVQRLETDCTDFSRYGLAEGDGYIRVTIEKRDGTKYTYHIGDLIPSEGGYYCRVEGRNAIYIMKAERVDVLLGNSESLLTPILGPQLDGSGSAAIEVFVLNKNGQRFVSIEFNGTEANEIAQSSYKMTYPAQYLVNDDVYSSEVLVALGSLKGYMVVCAGDGTAEGSLFNNKKLMAQYGFYDLDNPAYDLYYECEDVPAYIMFTESGTEGFYYAYSLIYDMIVLVEKTSVEFLEWDLLEYINGRLFYEHISNVSALSVSGNVIYNGKSYAINEKISYWYDTDDEMNCLVQSTGASYKGNTETHNYALGYYMVALMLYIDGYISDVENFSMQNAEEYARFTIEYIGGETQTYVFYRFGGNCYFTINGQGDFYVRLSTVNKLLVNAVRVANYSSVDPFSEFPKLPDNYIGNN